MKLASSVIKAALAAQFPEVEVYVSSVANKIEVSAYIEDVRAIITLTHSSEGFKVEDHFVDTTESECSPKAIHSVLAGIVSFLPTIK